VLVLVYVYFCVYFCVCVYDGIVFRVHVALLGVHPPLSKLPLADALDTIIWLSQHMVHIQARVISTAAHPRKPPSPSLSKCHRKALRSTGTRYETQVW